MAQPTITQKRVFAALPRTTRARLVRLTGSESKGKFLYCHGTSIFIRDVHNPLDVDIYTEHSKATSCARYSPSGFYIASGDTSGKVRIWDTVNADHLLKKEYQKLGGEMRDLDWSMDNQRIVVGGDGLEKCAQVFFLETGASAGELSFVSRVNAIAFRQTKIPKDMRIVAASEDRKVVLYDGRPFQFKKCQNCHTNFVNAVRYSPDGSIVISGSSDGKLFKYDGDGLEMISEICEPADEDGIKKPAHKGGIYDICFSPDGKEVLTVSGDYTAKIFNVESGEKVCEFNLDTKRPCDNWLDMGLGALWQNGEILVVCCSGYIHYLDRNTKVPKMVIKGHQQPITALALSEDKKTVFSASQEGIVYWDVESGINDMVSGTGHGTKEVRDIVLTGDSIFSVALDDTLRVISVSGKSFSDVAVKLDSQPRTLDSCKGVVVVACVKHIIVLGGDQAGLAKKKVEPLTEEPSGITMHPDGCHFAVGFNKEVRIYSLKGADLDVVKKVTVLEQVGCVAYSPDGAYLAFSSGKKVSMLDTQDYTVVGVEHIKHRARVCCLAWSLDSSRFASAALDNLLIVWKKEMGKGQETYQIKAHTQSHINKMAWVDANTIITAGQDSNIKQFTVPSE